MLEGYKETKVGIIPQHWIIFLLDDLVKVTDGAHRTPTYTSSGVPFLRVTDIAGPDIDLSKVKYVSKDEHNELIKRCKPERGDILYSKNGTIGIPRVVTWDWEFSTFVSLALLKIKDRDQVDVYFLNLYLASELAKREIYRSSKQGTVTNLHLEEIRKFRVPLPPLPEQRKIAEILCTWDEAIALVERRIEAARRRKKGLMQCLLTGRVRFPQFEGEEWHTVKLGEIFNERKERGYEDLPLLSVTAEEGIIYRDELDRRDTSSSDKSNYLRVREGDVAYNTMRMWQGRSGVSEYEGIVSPAYTVCEPKPTIDVDFVGYLFQLPSVIYKFRRYSQGLVSDTWTLRFDNFAAINVQIPSLDEQKGIAAVLETCDREIDLLIQKHDALQRQKKGLMQRLLTGRVRVKV